ncbi:hypothetical protein [Nocardia seriolae]|uniref:hypothetical protein n=2 Tax=Nocardia seriolae TaxID=37332 RepID=UPI000B09152A|nr:hypothetical protein [Nocardia seriolae]QUN19931.1 hypothetical protein KEC46_11795 [Nocardia seriolae]WNJ59411.1 hypothetical protein RMO66_00670 [Nocardia seriolae]
MTTSGQPAPGKRITLPSGALWEGGPTPGTSLVTLPEQDPILVSDNGSGVSNSLVGRSGPFAALAHAFEEVLGHVPNFFADRVASQALNLLRDNSKGDETETRIVKFSAKTTLLNPAKRNRQQKPEDPEERDDSVFDRQNPVRRARGGLVYRPGDTVADGGLVSGPGGPASDLVHLAASRGEYVVNADAAARALSLLDAINSGWVPSADFLAGMLPSLAGAAAGRTTAPNNPNQWRDLLGQGVIADTLGGLGNAAVDAASWAGAALGSALAPMFGPGGLFAARPGSAASAAVRNDADLTGSAVPMTASIQATPSATLGFLGTAQPNSPTGAAGELGSLAAALGSGISGAATAAGSRLGEMLGAAIQPALGPAGELAPVIGEQLGRLIGSQFGSQLTTSLTVQAGLGGGQASSVTGAGGAAGSTPGGAGADYSAGGSAPEPTPNDNGGGSVVENSGPAGTPSGGSPTGGNADTQPHWEYLPGSEDGKLASGWAYLAPTVNIATPPGMTAQTFVPDNGKPGQWVPGKTGTGWLDALTGNTTAAGAQTLADNGHFYNKSEGNFTDLVTLTADKVGRDLGTVLAPVLGEQAPQSFANFAKMLMTPIGEAYSAADPNHDWTNQIGQKLSDAFGIEWSPTGSSGTKSASQLSEQQQVGVAAFESGIQGLQQHSLLGGLTGAISGAGSTLGSLAGNFLGTLAAPFLGPAAALGPVIGQFVGSMIGSSIAEEFTRPIEWAGNAVKEMVGTGFGLTDLSAGPGGHTVRGDIYNFNGMDPKSAGIAVERVRRRRAVAQQRGGGFGR